MGSPYRAEVGIVGRVAVVFGLWLLCVAAAAGLVVRGQAHERDALNERFQNRAETGAGFVGAYVDDVFESERLLVPHLIRDLERPEQFARSTALIRSSAAVLLDKQGRAVAVAPSAPKVVGSQLAAGYPHLSSALGGERTVSDVVPSAVDGDPIVAFALPLAHDRFAVFSAGFSLDNSPLKALLARQPIAGTRGYIVDSQGTPIVVAGERAADTVRELDVRKLTNQPTVAGDRLLAGEQIPGTGWTYVLDAPIAAVHAPVAAGQRGDWLQLAGLAALSLLGLAAATAAMASRERARREKAEIDHRLRLTVQNAPIGMSMVSLDHRFVEPNRRLCQMLGYSAEELSRVRFEDVTAPADVDVDVMLVEQVLAGEIETYELEKTYLRKDGVPLLGRLSVSVVRDDQGDPLYFVSQIEDITEFRAAREELEYRALYDPLTGLANRNLLMDRLAEALDDDTAAGRVAMAFCDIDYFKQINDTRGHHSGDAVLRQVALRLRLAALPGHTVARMGGDEFTILMPSVSTADEAALVLAEVLGTLERPIDVDGRPIGVTMSIGLALADQGGDTESLLRNADVALYAAKKAGRARCLTYSESMRDPKAASGHAV